MITLSKKLRETKNNVSNTTGQAAPNKRTYVRDRLLVKEVADLEQNSGVIEVTFPDPDKLHEFEVVIRPEEGMWHGGKFKFLVTVPEEYNLKPPQVKCVTKLWHPNISLDGAVCLSILRDHSLDGSGWAPTRSIKDVVWGLASIFVDLVDFDDPLNIEAAEQYRKHPRQFQREVESYLFRYAT